MGFIAFTILGVALVASVNCVPQNPRNAVIEAGISNTLQTIREHLPCGFPERDLPPLAPYVNTEGIPIDWQFPSIQLVGALTSLRVDGAEHFIDERVSFDLPSMTMWIDFLHPELTFQGTFDAEGFFISDSCQISGTGFFHITLYNLVHQTTSSIGIRTGTDGLLNMDEMISRVRLERLAVRINSFVGGAAVTARCNLEIEQNLPAIVESNELKINEFLSAILVPAANYNLNQMTIMDLFDLINNPSTRPPCVP